MASLCVCLIPRPRPSCAAAAFSARRSPTVGFSPACSHGSTECSSSSLSYQSTLSAGEQGALRMTRRTPYVPAHLGVPTPWPPQRGRGWFRRL